MNRSMNFNKLLDLIINIDLNWRFEIFYFILRIRCLILQADFKLMFIVRHEVKFTWIFRFKILIVNTALMFDIICPIPYLFNCART